MSENEPQTPSSAAANGAADPVANGAAEPVSKPVSNLVAEAKAEAEKFRNEYLYLRAEFENYKKQVIKERSDMRKYGSERLVAELLGVLDIFETALSSEATADNVATFRKGIELTASSLKSLLQRFGVEEIPAAGVPFDPAMHEALSSEETDAHPPGHVSKVFKKPYKLHDRVIRPGQVVVAKPVSSPLTPPAQS